MEVHPNPNSDYILLFAEQVEYATKTHRNPVHKNTVQSTFTDKMKTKHSSI